MNGVQKGIKRWVAEAGVEGLTLDTRFVLGLRCRWCVRDNCGGYADGGWADPKMPAHFARSKLAE